MSLLTAILILGLCTRMVPGRGDETGASDGEAGKAFRVPEALQDGNLWMDSVADSVPFWRTLLAEMETVRAGGTPLLIKDAREDKTTIIIRKDPADVWDKDLVVLYTFGKPQTDRDQSEDVAEKLCMLKTGAFTGQTMDLAHYGDVKGLALWSEDLYPAGSTILLESSNTGVDAAKHLEEGEKLDQVKGNFSQSGFQFVVKQTEGLTAVSNSNTKGKGLCKEQLRLGYTEILKTILYPEKEASEEAISTRFLPVFFRFLWMNAAATNQHLQKISQVVKIKEEAAGDGEEDGSEDRQEDEEEEGEEDGESNSGEGGNGHQGGDSEDEERPKEKRTGGPKSNREGKEDKKASDTVLLEIRVKSADALIGLAALVSLAILHFGIDIAIKVYQLKIFQAARAGNGKEEEEGTADEKQGLMKERRTAMVRAERRREEVEFDDLPAFSIPRRKKSRLPRN